MFWHVMLMLFSPLYLMFGLMFRSEQGRLVLALHHQVLVLHRHLGKLIGSMKIKGTKGRSIPLSEM